VSFARGRLIAFAGAAGLALSIAGQAAGSAAQGPPDGPGRSPDAPKVRVLAKPSRDFNKALQVARRQAQVASAESGDAGTFPTPESLGVSSATLEPIAACESGGDPAAVSADGTYRGKYQFDYGTWASVGGSGDPAGAPEDEQDYRAAMLYAQSGSSPWPICG